MRYTLLSSEEDPSSVQFDQRQPGYSFKTIKYFLGGRIRASTRMGISAL
ncbi:MAG: hypothetical protein OJF50_004093 [Nitrospira sp.]|nr:hypothetical protein [Nitrospira sp.]